MAADRYESRPATVFTLPRMTDVPVLGGKIRWLGTKTSLSLRRLAATSFSSRPFRREDLQRRQDRKDYIRRRPIISSSGEEIASLTLVGNFAGVMNPRTVSSMAPRWALVWARQVAPFRWDWHNSPVDRPISEKT